MANILVIDDDAQIRALVALLLENLGHTALPVDSGRAAVQTLLMDPAAISAVLLDISIPGMTANETLQQLTQICPRLPVIALSGDLPASVRARLPQGSLAGCIYKPDLESALEATLTQALTQTSTSDPPQAVVPNLSMPTGRDLEDLRAEYLTICSEKLVTLANMLKTGDLDGLSVMGHSLKGSGGCFGLPAISRLGRLLEAAAIERNVAKCREFIYEMSYELTRTKTTAKGGPLLP